MSVCVLGRGREVVIEAALVQPEVMDKPVLHALSPSLLILKYGVAL